MLIRAYSDLHGFLPRVQPCDLLIIGGDICPIDGEYGDHEPKTQARWLKEVFNPWCDQLPVDQIVLIGGNHDAILAPKQGRGFTWELNEKVTYLLDSSVQIENGPSIFGSPWIPRLAGWPFWRPDFKLRQLAGEMPGGHDIWVLHSPPLVQDPDYTLDQVARGGHVGNPFVTSAVCELEPQLVICGHIHEAYGYADIGYSRIANASFIDENYTVRWRHFEIEWNDKDREVGRVQKANDDPELGLWWSCRPEGA